MGFQPSARDIDKQSCMRSIISQRFAGGALVILLVLVTIFHVLVITGLVPPEVVWGGSEKAPAQLIVLEFVSIVVNALMLVIVLIRAGFVQRAISDTTLRILLWVMFAIFVLNTLGNFVSENRFERNVFGPLTVFMALLTWRLALRKP